MPGARSILERFRPVGTPGMAAAAGVPADRVAELAAELEPVLAALDGVQAECAELRAEAAGRADRIRAAAAARAVAAVDRARAVVLGAQRAVYEEFRARARRAVLALRDDPDYPRLVAGLTAWWRSRGWPAWRCTTSSSWVRPGCRAR